MPIKPKQEYNDALKFYKDLENIRFPGLGGNSYGNVPGQYGQIFYLWETEIPQKGKTRSILYKVPDENYSHFELVTDFVIDDFEEDHSLTPPPDVVIEHGVIKYLSEGSCYKSFTIAENK